MIEKKTKALLRKLFGLFTALLVLGIPMIAFLEPYLDHEADTFTGGVPTTQGLIAMGSLGLFALIIVAILLFSVIPAIVELVKAIVAARREANGDIFP